MNDYIMINIKGLRKRISVFILLPVGLLLLVMGYWGFIQARENILAQWGQKTTLIFQKTAHEIDMVLMAPKALLNLIRDSTDQPGAENIREYIIDRIEQLPGVERVDVALSDREGGAKDMCPPMAVSGVRADGGAIRRLCSLRFNRAGRCVVLPPVRDMVSGREVVKISMDLFEDDHRLAARVEVLMRMSVILDKVRQSSWWKSNKSFVVDSLGRIHGASAERRDTLGEQGDGLEKEVLEQIRAGRHAGIVLERISRTREVAGFYGLKEAPWTLVMITSASDVFAPMVRFRWFYFMMVAVFVTTIILLISYITGRTIHSLKGLVNAAESLASGDFNIDLPLASPDEVGDLTTAFSDMALQLKERNQLKQWLELAMGIQKNLLPQSAPRAPGLDIHGGIKYCQQVGGDYYDYIDDEILGPGKLAVVVGDVSDHGIHSALLMATARSMIRQRASQPGRLTEIVSDVNIQFCRDIGESGHFMTGFFILFDLEDETVVFVNAGHEPALLYEPEKDVFEELTGPGLPLGIVNDFEYKAFSRRLKTGEILAVGTDGIWEAANKKGERFEKERLTRVLRENAGLSPREIIDKVFGAVKEFIRPLEIQDDMTLVVIKKV